MRLSFGKQRYHGGTTVALNEQGVSDSLHAAQAIFQNHSSEGSRPSPPFTVHTNAQIRSPEPSLQRPRQKQEQKKARIRTKQIPKIKTTAPNGIELSRKQTSKPADRDNVGTAQMAAALAHSQSKLNSDNNQPHSSTLDTSRVLETPNLSGLLRIQSHSSSGNTSNESLTLAQRTADNRSQENLFSPFSSSERLSSSSTEPATNKDGKKALLKRRPSPPLQTSTVDNGLLHETENMSSVSIDSRHSLNLDTSDVISNRSQMSLSQTINQLSLYESEPSIASSSTTTTTNNQGSGLPNLVPNYSSDMRKKKLVNKFKQKVFGAKPNHTPSQYEGDATNEELGQHEQQSSMKFKTTLRKTSVSATPENNHTYSQHARNVRYKYNSANDTYDIYSDTDSDSGSDQDQGTLTKPRKRDRFKRKIKNSANKTTHHRPIHRTRNRKFNEDKPWKSHTDITFVTDNERKRYESMWVSNRHRHLDLLSWWPTLNNESVVINTLPEDGLILNIIVCDIWKRSNLPDSLLAEIYTKVDTRKDGTLDRKSFIVGMWLVDQCLYGRKLPNVVEQCVWDSVDRYASTTVVPVSTLKAMAKQKKKQMKEEIKNIKKENRVVLIDHNSPS
ncbi:hypothetical protein SMKI_11G2270 [Saccharomyces mikatae IFO 1815]|uniref:EH domain-containing protein n=1 Tax=Saccharomyces mikatae IFO 1815 TaxID=226126 RepID=A0AA35IQ10_SACMI|nr:uncharacterized protein SMKI_11G2270 [Saccharomyces mikatae IFO 1815]CAI4034777.1 hypothetical protein SMKI_11G2270 [Saccharomyces mikatae IFO 1815]